MIREGVRGVCTPLVALGIWFFIVGCVMVYVITLPPPSVNERSVLDYIVEDKPTQESLERHFNLNRYSSNRTKLACVVNELIEDNLVEYTEIGGFLMYCVTDSGLDRWRELFLSDVVGGEYC